MADGDADRHGNEDGETNCGSNNVGAYIGHVRQGSNSIGDLVFATRKNEIY